MSADGLARNTRTVSLLTLASRITGLARDAALSRCFGIGPVMDAFAFAFMLPNLFRRLFGEGALSAAFLPVYARLERDDPAQARRLLAVMVRLLLGTLLLLVLLGEAILLGLWWVADRGELTLQLMMITLPYMPLVCLVAVLGAALQVHGRFGPTAAAPIILNGFMVVAALGAGGLPMVATAADPLAARAIVVSLAVGLAGVAQVAWSLAALGGLGVAWRAPIASAWDSVRTVLRQAGPMILGLGVLQLNTFVDGLIASWPSTIGPTILGIQYPLDPGALAALGYAQRLYEFPLGVFGIAVATAIFPLLARQHGEPEAFAETLRRGLRLVAFIGVPASVGLLLVGRPLTATILQGGDFGAADTDRVAFILAGYAPAVWVYSMNHTFTRALYAQGDSRSPVRISLLLVGLNFLLNVLLIWTPLREAGLAWSTAACACLQALLLARVLRRRTGRILDGGVGGSWIRTGIATALMAAVVAPLTAWLAPAEAGWSRMALALAAAVLAGGATFAAAAALLRMVELRWLLARGRA